VRQVMKTRCTVSSTVALGNSLKLWCKMVVGEFQVRWTASQSYQPRVAFSSYSQLPVIH